jgi:hypothetical protein
VVGLQEAFALGCGLLAALQVGPTERVCGLHLTRAMLDRLQRRLQFRWMESPASAERIRPRALHSLSGVSSNGILHPREV